jgi:hypothetical protein
MRPALRITSAALLALCSACQGRISDPAGATGSGATAGAPNAGGSSTSGPSDDELRGKDPQLFEVALRYFPGQTPAPGKKRLFRLTRAQLDLTARSLLPGAYAESPTAAQTLPRDPLQTNYEYADNLSFGAASFTPLTSWVDGLALAVKADPESVLACQATPDDMACVDAAARAFVKRAFRGVVSDATLARFAAYTVKNSAQVGLAQAAADLVELTFTSPSFVFREEVSTDAGGQLLPAQLLQNLSYTLADSPPEALGFATPPPNAAALDEAEVSLAVQQALEKPAARAKLLRFFLAWLEVREPAELDISPSVYPELTPEAAAAVVEDTRAFLASQLAGVAPRLSDLTEGNELQVSPDSAFLYGLEPSFTGGRVTLDPAQRLGIFSQPAVIASHSGPTTTRLVKRGVFFTRKVMCLPLGQPPPDVDTTLPETTTASERQRIESVTGAPRCAGCHAFINPFGFTLESYDAIGRYREREGDTRVDPAISVDFLDEGPLSAATTVEALRGFTRSLRFQQCFTRQLFRFYAGRDETAEDDPLLRRLFFEFASGRQELSSLLRGLAAAASFSSRREVP